MPKYDTKKFIIANIFIKNFKFVSQCIPLNDKITYIRLLRKNSITVLPQIAHLREIVLLEGHLLVKLSLMFQK